eukprot:gene21588-28587_t
MDLLWELDAQSRTRSGRMLRGGRDVMTAEEEFPRTPRQSLSQSPPAYLSRGRLKGAETITDMGSYNFKPAQQNMHPAQRQWFVDASFYDPESGSSVNMDR